MGAQRGRSECIRISRMVDLGGSAALSGTSPLASHARSGAVNVLSISVRADVFGDCVLYTDYKDAADRECGQAAD